MNAIFKSKKLNSVVILETVCVAMYVTGKMYHRYKYILLMLYIVFLGAVIIAGVREMQKNKKAPEWWLFYKHTEKFLRGFVIVCVTTIGFYGMALLLDSYSHSAGQNTITNAEKALAQLRYQGESILANTALLEDLQPETYVNLSVQERANVFYRVMQIEAEYLGISIPELEILSLKSGIVSRYCYKEDVVQINQDYLCCEEEVLKGVLHEMYHAYQYTCINQVNDEGELLFYRQVEAWREDFSVQSAGTSLEESYLEYYVQDSEIAARKYAEERAGEYGKLIVLENH